LPSALEPFTVGIGLARARRQDLTWATRRFCDGLARAYGLATRLQLEPVRGYVLELVRLRRGRGIIRLISEDASALELGHANERREA
jgi:hypothetical protein